MRGVARTFAALSSSIALVGCASTSPEPAFRNVAQTVEARTAHRIAWNQNTADDREVERMVHRMLSDPLTLDAAVKVALVSNRSLLATYEELGVAQADLVQAGLLKNPRFSLAVTTAEADRLDPNLVFGIGIDFFDIFMIPARKKIARAQLDAAELRVGDAVLGVVADVRAAYFACVGAMQMVEMRRMIAEAAQASAEVAQRQNEAGNTSDLVFANERGLFEQTALDLARSEAEVVEAREKLTRAMGVWGEDAAWRVTPRLPNIPKDEVSLDRLESLAIAQRLDLAAMRGESQALAYALSFVRSTRFTPGADIGLEVARLTDGKVHLGPNGSIELPIFDQRQAAIAKLEALLRQSQRRAEARAIEIRSEVRVARERVVFARRVALRYETVLIPLRERIVALSQQEYDAMLLGVYQLLLAKQSEVNAYREYIESVRDYWLARSDLERAVGGRLGRGVEVEAAATSTPPPAASSAAPAEHHHHN